MSFQIMRQVEGKNFEPAIHKRTRGPLVYACPKRAAQIAGQLTRRYGVKFQPRPLMDVAWRTREQQRMVDEHYKPVVWIGQEWWDNEHNPHHYAHVSLVDPTKIGFTRNDKDGSADVQTAMKPGKYLTEFFAEVLSTERIKEAAMQHSMTYEQKEVKFATTPEDIERVYKPSIGYSCFSGTTKANLYGSGDFAVAYIERDGEITARAICAPSRKIYIRPYGDSVRLQNLLDKMGFEHDGDWTGLRLLKKWHWRGFYADFDGHVIAHPTDPDYMIIA